MTLAGLVVVAILVVAVILAAWAVSSLAGVQRALMDRQEVPGVDGPLVCLDCPFSTGDPIAMAMHVGQKNHRYVDQRKPVKKP